MRRIVSYLLWPLFMAVIALDALIHGRDHDIRV